MHLINTLNLAAVLIRTTIHLVIWLLLLPEMAVGQDLVFNTFDKSSGLVHFGSIFRHSLLKDKDGFLWIATGSGLSRFDGERFKNYKIDVESLHSLKENDLTCLYEDRQGNIWIGTVKSGIYLLDKVTDKFTQFPLQEKLDFNDRENVLQEFDSGRFICSDTWQAIIHYFSSYGKGLRYIYFEHGGKDAEFWSGHYGSIFDNSEVVLFWDDLTTSTEEVGSGNAMQIFPNPSKGHFNIDFGNLDTHEKLVEIFNLEGKCIKIKKLDGAKRVDFNLTSQNAGTYIIRMKDANQTVSKKVIID